MTPRRAWLVAIALTAASAIEAAGQGMPFPAQEPPCMKDFMPLRQEAEKRAAAVHEASKRKAPPQEACQLLSRFVEAEAKVVKFVEKEGAWCGIPDQAVKGMKDNHAQSQKIRSNVCAAAAARPAAPKGPSFSETLGTTRVPDASTAAKGRGTFDTLTGNALAR